MMSRIKPEYGRLGAVGHQLFRHGLMHLYLPKPGIGVVRDKPAWHLRRNPDDGSLIFDCEVLAVDFRRSYEEHSKQAVMDDPHAQDRLDAMGNEAQTASQRHLASVVETFPMMSAPVQGGTTVASQYPGL